MGREPRFPQPRLQRQSNDTGGEREHAESPREESAIAETIEQLRRAVDRIRDELPNDGDKCLFDSILERQCDQEVVHHRGTSGISAARDDDGEYQAPWTESYYNARSQRLGTSRRIDDYGTVKKMEDSIKSRVSPLYRETIAYIDSLHADVRQQLLGILTVPGRFSSEQDARDELWFLSHRDSRLDPSPGRVTWESAAEEREIYAPDDVVAAQERYAKRIGVTPRATALVNEYRAFPEHWECHAAATEKNGGSHRRVSFFAPSGESLSPNDGNYWRFAPLDALILGAIDGRSGRGVFMELPNGDATSAQREAFLGFIRDTAERFRQRDNDDAPTEFEGDLAIPGESVTLRMLLGGSYAIGIDEMRTGKRAQAVRKHLEKIGAIYAQSDPPLPWHQFGGKGSDISYEVENGPGGLPVVPIREAREYRNGFIVLEFPAEDGIAEIIHATSGSGRTNYYYARWRPNVQGSDALIEPAPIQTGPETIEQMRAKLRARFGGSG